MARAWLTSLIDGQVNDLREPSLPLPTELDLEARLTLLSRFSLEFSTNLKERFTCQGSYTNDIRQMHIRADAEMEAVDPAGEIDPETVSPFFLSLIQQDGQQDGQEIGPMDILMMRLLAEVTAEGPPEQTTEGSSEGPADEAEETAEDANDQDLD